MPVYSFSCVTGACKLAGCGDPLHCHHGCHLACEAHGGRLVRTPGGWFCAGFDGEALCTTGPISDEAAARILSGQTRWPGVVVRE